MKNDKKIKEKTMKIQPLQDRILIKESVASVGERTTASGFIIPVNANEDKGAKKGEVIAVGPGRYDDGKLIPLGVKVGDIVLYSWGDTVKVDGEEYSIVRESEVIAIIK